MANTKRFDVGDRVRMTRQTESLAQGMLGTIQIVFLSVDVYRVQFDGVIVPRIIHHVDLELAELDERMANAS